MFKKIKEKINSVFKNKDDAEVESVKEDEEDKVDLVYKKIEQEKLIKQQQLEAEERKYIPLRVQIEEAKRKAKMSAEDRAAERAKNNTVNKVHDDIFAQHALQVSGSQQDYFEIKHEENLSVAEYYVEFSEYEKQAESEDFIDLFNKEKVDQEGMKNLRSGLRKIDHTGKEIYEKLICKATLKAKEPLSIDEIEDLDLEQEKTLGRYFGEDRKPINIVLHELDSEMLVYVFYYQYKVKEE